MFARHEVILGSLAAVAIALFVFIDNFMDAKTYILIFLVLIAFLALVLLALRRFTGWLVRFMLNFWSNAGVIGAKDGSMDNARINGFVLVGSVLFILLGGIGMIAIGGLQYFQFKFLALLFVVVLLAPLIAKRLGRRNRK